MADNSFEAKKLPDDVKQQLALIANTIRVLSIEGVQKANSGHPGLPMGCAEIGAYLYGHLLKHCPKKPKWMNRDRFILSAGHGSMWLYSCLHLAQFNLPLEELKKFRQLHSKTPGHPEYLETEGVETTTGPLGQGIGNAVGQALGMKILAARYNRPNHELLDSKVFVLAGDGCMMEGVSGEASSFAGHLGLDNLVVIYDANKISLDGPLSDSQSEDTQMRYRSYGFDVFDVDGHDLDQLHSVFTHIRHHQTRPCLVVTHTTIGKGSPHKAGTNKVHGSPLGPDEVKATKAGLGWPEEEFHVPQPVRSFFEQKLIQDGKQEQEWQKRFNEWAKAYPKEHEEMQKALKKELPSDFEEKVRAFAIASPIGGRSASYALLDLLSKELGYLYGGSADLSCSDMTMMKDFPVIQKGQFLGRNLKYGVREFGMAAIAIGLHQTDQIIPYIGTFLTFSDYMRNAVRLAAIMRLQVIYQFTHDSIFLGEDGPTHQPVEHYAALRTIPHLQVIRPADANEVKMAWLAALKYQGPTALILSRQNLPNLETTDVSFAEGMGRGAYIVRKEKGKPDYTLLATGSEVSLAINVAQSLEKMGKSVRVISMPCFELFESQPESYKKEILGGDLGVRVSIEAGVEFGWHKYIGSDGIAIAMEGFGASAPASDLAKQFGFTVEAILERIL
ncbi:MAG: tkt [Chlamydiales bacterium]|jgi:transketolase|nr:tkt [Chlamydiales bacterium]